MDVETGLLRIAKIVYVLGLDGQLSARFSASCSPSATKVTAVSSVVAFLAGVVGHGIAWSVAWIIRGFAQKKAS